MIFANFFIYTKIFTTKMPVAETASLVPDEILENQKNNAAEETTVLPLDSKYINANISDTYSGELILVNNDHPYTFDNVTSVVAKESNVCVYEAKSKSYFTKDNNVFLDKTAIESLNRMMDDYYAQNGNKKNIIITQGVRTFEEQQTMLELKKEQYGENQTIAQTPGYSEHHTGYAFDISTYVNSIMDTFTGEGEYAWIHENAHKYGFVLRYPEGKEDITGISYESWHFRYVGVPHAQYMYKNGKTLEEYISELSSCKFNESELSVTDEATGTMYSVYAVPVVNDGAQVPVPSDASGKEYTLSGDNCGHIIITVKETSTAA